MSLIQALSINDILDIVSKPRMASYTNHGPIQKSKSIFFCNESIVVQVM